MTSDLERSQQQLRSAYPAGSNSVAGISAAYIHVVLARRLRSHFIPKSAERGWYSALAARVQNPVGYRLENDSEQAELRASLLAFIGARDIPEERFPGMVAGIESLILREALDVIEPHPDD